MILGVFQGRGDFDTWTFKAEHRENGWLVTPSYVGPPTQLRAQGPIEIIMADGELHDVRQLTGGHENRAVRPDAPTDGKPATPRVAAIGTRAALVKKYLPGCELRAVRGPSGDYESKDEVLMTPGGQEVDLASVRNAWRGTIPTPDDSSTGLQNPKLMALLPRLKIKIATDSEAEDVARMILSVFQNRVDFDTWAFKAEHRKNGWLVTPSYVGPPRSVLTQRPIELIMVDGELHDVRQREYRAVHPGAEPTASRPHRRPCRRKPGTCSTGSSSGTLRRRSLRKSSKTPQSSRAEPAQSTRTPTRSTVWLPNCLRLHLDFGRTGHTRFSICRRLPRPSR